MSVESSLRWLYNGLLIPGARLVQPILARTRPKIARGVAARRGLLERWSRAVEPITTVGPRIWLHAASAGETLQAKPIADAIRNQRPNAAIFFSFFSPSAERYVEGWQTPDAIDYLPFDVAGPTRRMFEILRPDALVLVSGELWPNLVWSASEAGVSLAQVCCRLGPHSGRRRWPMRSLSDDLYRRFTAIGAVAAPDAQRLVALGVPADLIAVTGDTRFEITLTRLKADADSSLPWGPPSGNGPVVVAGSTWPSDEAVLVPAIARLRARHPDLVSIVAPHEPTPEALTRLEGQFADAGLQTARMGSLASDEGSPVVLVDKVGILYRLYAIADLAYVGGGFQGAVHNTMEPAAHTVPVAVGADHGHPFEVGEMVADGGLIEVTSARELAETWGRWLDAPDLRRAAGRAARTVIEKHRGAADRTLMFLREKGIDI